MGILQSKSSLISNDYFIKNIQNLTPLVAKQNKEYKVVQIISHSPEHHLSILQKIRVKKTYKCQYIIRIIDSHTIQSNTFCSNIIKTILLMQNPETLLSKIQKRKQSNKYFRQEQVFRILHSCVLGLKYLKQQNIPFYKITSQTIFIDQEQNIKINDPQLCQSLVDNQSISQFLVLKDLAIIVQNIGKQIQYSKQLIKILQLCKSQRICINELIQIINIYNQCNDTQTQNSLPSLSSCCEQLGGQKKQFIKVNKKFPRKKSTRISRIYKQQQLVMDKDKQNMNMIVNMDQNKQIKNEGLFTFKNLFEQMNQLDNDKLHKLDNDKIHKLDNDKMSHKFPNKKVLKRNKKQGFSQRIKPNNYIQKQYQNHLIQFQVDQQTLVSQLQKDKSSYILQLVNRLSLHSNYV